MSATSNMSDLRSGSEVFHQVVERVSLGGPHGAGQMGVKSRSARTAMAQVVLNQPQVNACFQQVRSVGMSQRMDMGSLVDAALLPGALESTLHTATRHRPPLMGQTVGQSMPVSYTHLR